MVSPLLTISEAAEQLGVSVERVRQIERAGQIQALRTSHGMRLFLADEVRELRARREQAKARVNGTVA
jgi:excisionase family DNA binding protein